MKNCVIKFEFGSLPNQKFVLSNVEVDENTDTILRKIAEKIINSKNDNEVRDIKTHLEDSVSQSTRIDASNYKSSGSNFVPNYTGKALTEAFPNFHWGDNVPDVLLVDGLTLAGTTLNSKVIHVDKNGNLHESYVVSENYLSQFALLTRIWSNTKAITSIYNEEKEKPGTIQETLNRLEKESQEDCGKEAEYQRYKDLVIMLEYARDLFLNVSENLNTEQYLRAQAEYMINRIDKINQAYRSVYGSRYKLESKISNILKTVKSRDEKIADLGSKENELKNIDPQKDEEKINKLNEDIEKLKKQIEANESSIQRDTTSIQNSFDYLNSNIQAYTIFRRLFDENDKETIQSILESKEFSDLKNRKNTATNYIASLNKTREARLELIKEIQDLVDIDTERYASTNAFEELVTRYGVKDNLSAERKGISAFESFVDKVINNDNVLELLAPGNYDLQNKIDVFLQMLYGRNRLEDFGDSTANVIINHALSHNNVIHFSYIKKYINQTTNRKGDISNDEAFSFLTNISRLQNKYWFKKKDQNTFTIERKTTRISHNIKIDGFDEKAATEYQDMRKFVSGLTTLYDIDPIMNDDNKVIRKHGYYLYKLTNRQGKDVYYALKDKITSVTPGWLSRGFDNVIDAENYAEQKFQNSRLKDGLLFLRKGEITEDSMIPTSNDREWTRGEIAESIQYKLGVVGVEGMTVSQFEYWIHNIFGEDQEGAKKLLDTLDTLEKRAVFKTYYKRNVWLTDRTKQEMFDLANDIANSKTTYFMAVQDTVKIGHKPKNNEYDQRSRYTRFRQLTNTNASRTVVKKRGSQNTSLKIKSITDWLAIKNIFSNAGVHMELLNNQQMKDKTRSNNVIAFQQNGIIYINTDIATMEKALHEYSHLFLAMIKSTENGNVIYGNILSQYASAMGITENQSSDSYGDKVYRDKLALYKDKMDTIADSRDKYLYVLEEMFADDYGKYLQGQTGSLTTIFSQMNQVVSDFAVLSKDKAETLRLFQDGETKFSLFSKLINLEKAREQTGFPQDYSKGPEVQDADVNYESPYEQALTNFIGGIAQTKVQGKSLDQIAKDSTKKSSIFKKCD